MGKHTRTTVVEIFIYFISTHIYIQYDWGFVHLNVYYVEEGVSRYSHIYIFSTSRSTYIHTHLVHTSNTIYHQYVFVDIRDKSILRQIHKKKLLHLNVNRMVRISPKKKHIYLLRAFYFSLHEFLVVCVWGNHHS